MLVQTIPTTRARILLVDDEKDNLAALERTLRSHYDILTAQSGEDAVQFLYTTAFSAILCDQRMPGMSGTEVLEQALKLQPNCSRMALTAFTEVDAILSVVNRAQIFRFIAKPWNNADLLHAVEQAVQTTQLKVEREKLVASLTEKNQQLESKERELKALNRDLEKMVEQRTIELKKANDRLSDLAMTDPLTKLLNRRAMFSKLTEELERARRYGHPVVLGMIDVDHFKTFNDMEGHLSGDEALKKVAAILTSNLRKTDSICRYGGEEFLIVMPETKMLNAQEICNRLRGAVETTEFRGQHASAYLTVSLGLAAYPTHGTTSEALIQAADEALYEAKRIGRNRVVVHQ
jgi:diguanylate cyclase (GGDEF)-like protein